MNKHGITYTLIGAAIMLSFVGVLLGVTLGIGALAKTYPHFWYEVFPNIVLGTVFFGLFMLLSWTIGDYIRVWRK